MSKLRAAKGLTIKSAVVTVHGSMQGGGFNHADLRLYTDESEDSYSCALKLQFQRHLLVETGSDRSTAESIKAILPPPQFDFGDYAWRSFYGGHVDMDHDFSADFGGIMKMKRAITLIEKLRATIEEFNIASVSHDELEQFVMALEKLKVPVRLVRYLGNQKFEYLSEIPDKLRLPAQAKLAAFAGEEKKVAQ